MRPIIKAENVSKQYRIGVKAPAYRTLRAAVGEALRNPLRQLRGGGQGGDTIWALSGVGFEVRPGEVVGIVGSNGAGKSTLLKILSRIVEPTTGRVELYGRVGSLLEVGTGFHQELTGRENVFLNGAMLGMKRAEITRKFDEIVAFSGVEKFIDTPVKWYSSGMYMRLAFAVAAHLEPEVLIVDEVLAVGDANFQKKCIGKMSGVAEQGRTVLFVSHNLTAMQGLCSRVIWLHEGRVVADGATGQVISDYLKTSFSARTTQVWDDPATAPGNETVRLRAVRVYPEGGSPSDPLTVRTPVVLEFEYWNLQPATVLNLSLHLVNEEGVLVFASGSGKAETKGWEEGRPLPAGLFRSRCRVPGGLLNDGVHTAQLLAVKDQSVVIHSYPDVLSFDVREDAETRQFWFGKWPGAVRPDLGWSTELIEARLRESVGA
jgi:lipopolysaccharide transport system ATP-binding protein